VVQRLVRHVVVDIVDTILTQVILHILAMVVAVMEVVAMDLVVLEEEILEIENQNGLAQVQASTIHLLRSGH